MTDPAGVTGAGDPGGPVPDGERRRDLGELPGPDPEVEALAYAATHDVLTGLPNRELLYRRLSRALELHYQEDETLAVIFFDLDRFKKINDSLGHRAGDELLVAASRRIEAVVRPTDLVARFGGDEFVVVCARIREIEALGVADRIREALERAFTIEGQPVYISASLGVAFPRGADADPDGLLSDADAAMFEAKRRGRSRTEVFARRLRERALERLETEAALRVAIETDNLRLAFQPIVELESGMTRGVEALIRWDHPHRGVMDPQAFILLAEETGLICQVGAWAARRACSCQAEWDRLAALHGTTQLTTAINVSAHQLVRPDLMEALESCLGVADFVPGRIRLEITESAVIEEPTAGLSALRALKQLGVGLILDDFGTGYASLSALRRFPLDGIKIDKSFVSGMVSHRQDRAIISAVAGLAEDLGLELVAEGVESERQREMLLELGCRLGQGFLFSKALEEGQVRRLLGA
ncbi:MAG: putative bifunctional diguanylate cyclase/phosphodiesterase [Acidimicrobiales bacterium]